MIDKKEITPEWLYLNRRQFLKKAAIIGSGTILAACAPGLNASPEEEEIILSDELTPYETITTYNNFYEFSLTKELVAKEAEDFKTDPWQVAVSGLVKNPITLQMQDILDQFPQEERVYRLRCVEGWSMVIPWVGFSFSKILDLVEPTEDAQFVVFESLADEAQMPGLTVNFPWPFREGLRIDEARNELATIVTGMYGKPLPPQDGAPVRLVVPWKYGFKSAKSIIKIELVAERPKTFWNTIAPREYGFFSNVNPDVRHPRWSQSTERRIGELERRPTLLFNGYDEEVAYLYEGMDLRASF